VQVYDAVKWGKPAPYELKRWILAERFGWTLKYIDSLSQADWLEFLQVEEGRKKAVSNG